MARLFLRLRQSFSILLMLSLPLLALYPDTVSAMTAGQAFNGLLGNADTSVNAPGYYHTEARGAFVGGGFDVHFANSNFQLINITPPSFSAGCGGISMFFGGFSFISGAQFSQLVQNILQAALGYAIQLAIQTLCPACEAVLQVLQKAAQMANSMANNTCHLAKEAVNFGAGLLGLGKSSAASPGKSGQTGVTSKCAALQASNGGGSGFLSSLNSGVCQFAGKAMNTINNWMTTLNGATASGQANKMRAILGNTTYQTLHALGLTSSNELADILMSLMGTNIIFPSANSAESHYHAPLWSGGIHKTGLRPLVFLYLCGTSQGNEQALPSNTTDASIPAAEIASDFAFCQKLSGDSANPWAILNSAQLYYCNGTASGSGWTWPNSTPSLGACTTLSTGSVGFVDGQQQWSYTSSIGFLRYVQNQLGVAVGDVENGNAMPASAVALIQEAPFPLYQIINLAVVYPTTANELLANASQAIALLLTEHMLVDIMDNVSQASQSTINNKQVRSPAAVLQILSTVKDAQMAVTQRALTLSTYELQMMHEVRQVQRLVQDQVAQEGLMGNQQYSQALMSNVTLNQPQP